jgi:hypothetical protein
VSHVPDGGLVTGTPKPTLTIFGANISSATNSRLKKIPSHTMRLNQAAYLLYIVVSLLMCGPSLLQVIEH